MAGQRELQVLVVEDDEGDVLMIEEALGDRSLHVVSDGVEAVDHLKRGQAGEAVRPDLILLDLNMPRMGGRDVLAFVKADPDLAAIPVVVLTTSSSPEDILSSYHLHANAYVTKPVDLDAFLAAVGKIDEFYAATVRLPD
jgi:two-component system response regulator